MGRINVVVIGESGGTPLAGGATSCYMVEAEGYAVLLDIGSGALSLLQKIRPFDSIDDIIISHFHSDHVADAGVAIYSRLIAMQLGRHVHPLLFHAMEKRELEMAPYSSAVIIDEGIPEKIGPFSISYIRTIHPVPCLAMKLSYGGKSVVYTADGAFSEKIAEFSSSSDILIAECSFYPGTGSQESGHMDVYDVVKLAAAASPGKLIVSHLPVYGNRNEILDYIKGRWNGEVLLAHPFLELEV